MKSLAEKITERQLGFLKTVRRDGNYRDAWLRDQIQRMTPKWKLYRLLKQELHSRGWWKNRSRGRHAQRAKG